MDSHEVLKAARRTKERGNDSFKGGKLQEAQTAYMEMLAMLTEEVIVTGDNQKKEKETLVLAAHLNLAQCALRLEDYTTVIHHCNIALDMDSNNIKAHFRKARAFQNMSELAKALESYCQVLTLDPNNEAVQKQLDECQKNLDSQKSEGQMSNAIARLECDDCEDNDVAVVYEDSEGGPKSLYTKCKKNPGHTMFINASEFEMHHLPPCYREQIVLDHVRNQIKITVMLKVKGASQHRPEYSPETRDKYPASGKRHRRAIRYGSGWLIGVSQYDRIQPCPCLKCKASGSPKKGWAEIHIYTAAHVVFDEIEGSKTECYFCFDAEGVDLDSCPSLSGAVKVESGIRTDNSVLTFISHDEKFSDELHRMFLIYHYHVCGFKQNYNVPAASAGPEQNIVDKFRQLQQHFGELLKEERQLVEKLKTIVNGDPRVEFLKYQSRRKNKFELDDLGKMLFNKLRGRNEYKELLKQLLLQYEGSCHFFKGISIPEGAEKALHFPGIREGFQKRYNAYFCSTKKLENDVIRLKRILCEDETSPPHVETYNKDHPLTIIVSHPHGCSKKITIGEVIEKTNPSNGDHCQYIYSNATCPGSSGALVFVLGQGWGTSLHPHSASRTIEFRLGGQMNESGFNCDI